MKNLYPIVLTALVSAVVSFFVFQWLGRWKEKGRLAFLGLWVFGSLGLCHAGRVTVAWSPSPSAATNPVTYVLYGHTNALGLAETNLNTAAVRAHVGTNLISTIIFTEPGHWFLVATARDTNHVESVPSNMLMLLIPEPPGPMGTVTVEHTINVTGTNWTDVGFFRLRIE